jgi:hypothetical protein
MPSRQDAPPSCFAQHFPEAALRPRIAYGPRSAAQFCFHWEACHLVHQPLYFEDVALERYGQGFSPILQPVVSGARFVAGVATLPYRIGVDAPCELIYTLGHERPGDCVPSVCEQLPWSWRGAALQTGAILGGIVLVP